MVSRGDLRVREYMFWSWRCSLGKNSMPFAGRAEGVGVKTGEFLCGFSLGSSRGFFVLMRDFAAA